VIRTTARLERAIPSSPAIDRYVREQQPDVVLATSVVARLAAGGVPEERPRARIAATLVASWDNLTNKGLLSGSRSRSSSGTRSRGGRRSSSSGCRPTA
jgi:hypothetical protein